MNTIAVPRPTNAGSGQLVIVNTRLAFVNVRSGPGTQFSDIGDIRDFSLAIVYPATRTSDNWVWVEMQGVRGWISSGVVTFENAVGSLPPPSVRPTPYDNKVALWHWKGSSLQENTIEELAAGIKRKAPNVRQVWVKTSDGVDFMGEYDNSRMAIDGPADVDRWVQTLERFGLEFHAWCVPQGLDIQNETQRIIDVCRRPGVESMILDIEPYTGFWQGGREAIRPFMLRIRRELGTDFHIGMSMDPRPQHFNSIFPQEWHPFINSVHPQIYWASFRRTVEESIAQAMDTWGNYGKPIIPALQADADVNDQRAAYNLMTQRHNSRGISWWREGVTANYSVVNQTVQFDPSKIDQPDQPVTEYADETLVVPNGPGFRSGTYTGQQEFSQFDGTWNWKVLYKATEVRSSRVWAEWKTDLPDSGRYEISTFVPARHATTTRARFKVHGIRGTNTEVVVDINQDRNRNTWVPLGIFDLVRGQTNAGKVFLNDVTGEAGREIAFDAVRFRRIITSDPVSPGDVVNGTTRPSVVNGVRVADGYDAPVGSQQERRSSQLWPPGWRDAAPFAQLYFAGTPSAAYHTGADLNFGTPFQDKGMPIYSIANGVVTFAGALSVWGNVVIVRHDPLYVPGGEVTYARYGHVQSTSVRPGDRVVRGQQVAEIGDAFGRYTPHLHFDISPTSILESRPQDWPGLDRARLLKTYIDPKYYISQNRP